jgi:hypothetical protein
VPSVGALERFRFAPLAVVEQPAKGLIGASLQVERLVVEPDALSLYGRYGLVVLYLEPKLADFQMLAPELVTQLQLEP